MKVVFLRFPREQKGQEVLGASATSRNEGPINHDLRGLDPAPWCLFAFVVTVSSFS